jgi:hypothetical protein
MINFLPENRSFEGDHLLPKPQYWIHPTGDGNEPTQGPVEPNRGLGHAHDEWIPFFCLVLIPLQGNSRMKQSHSLKERIESPRVVKFLIAGDHQKVRSNTGNSASAVT